MQPRWKIRESKHLNRSCLEIRWKSFGNSLGVVWGLIVSHIGIHQQLYGSSLAVVLEPVYCGMCLGGKKRYDVSE